MSLYIVENLGNKMELSPNASTNNVLAPNNSTYSINDIIKIFKSKLKNTYSNQQNVKHRTFFQSVNNIENEFGVDERYLEEVIKEDIENVLLENGLDKLDVAIEGVRIYGSYANGTNKENSDLDAVVLYSGDITDDALFNILNEVDISMPNLKNEKINVDINPINKAEYATIDDYLEYIGQLEPANKEFIQQDYATLKEKHENKLLEEVHRYRGYFRDGNENIITIMENADASTLVHELGHVFLSSLNEFAKDDEKAREQLNEIDEKLGRITGEDYTDEQHEQFAKWFEAYLYTGKAPSYTLREVFENFKEWLRQIAQYWDKTYDMPKSVKKVFDKMFSEEKTAYDKEQEVKVKKILAKVKNITLSDKLTDLQKRHKRVAYEIVSAATGKSVRYLQTVLGTKNKNNKSIRAKQEAIEELIVNASDNITGSNGMLLSWLEFYPDTGVSYNNDEVGADVALAKMAYDDIINESFLFF